MCHRLRGTEGTALIQIVLENSGWCVCTRNRLQGRWWQAWMGINSAGRTRMTTRQAQRSIKKAAANSTASSFV